QKKGHRKNECRKFKADQRNGTVAERVTMTAPTITSNTTPSTSIFTALSIPQITFNHNNWLLDSGCSNHVTGLNKWFTSNKPIPPGDHKIRVANNSEVNALGRGDITLNVWDTLAGENCMKHLILTDVLHVPDCGQNSLLSVSELRKAGVLVDFYP